MGYYCKFCDNTGCEHCNGGNVPENKEVKGDET